jgi:type I restriction-modification system DNA methylase subunit
MVSMIGTIAERTECGNLEARVAQSGWSMAMVERRKVRRIATSTPERITWPATLEMARCLAEQVGNDLAKSAKHRGQDAHRLYRATQRAVLQSLVESLSNGQEAKAARSHANGTLGTMHELPSLDHSAIGSLYEALLSLHPVFDVRGAFSVKSGSGHARKSSGSYYTPAGVVERILDLTLTPALREAAREGGAKGILRLRVCDPSCGTGNFVLAAARRVAEFLARARRARNPPHRGCWQAA